MDILAEILATERTAVDVRMNWIDARLLVHKNKWKEVILKKPETTAPGPAGLIIIPPF